MLNKIIFIVNGEICICLFWIVLLNFLDELGFNFCLVVVEYNGEILYK